MLEWPGRSASRSEAFGWALSVRYLGMWCRATVPGRYCWRAGTSAHLIGLQGSVAGAGIALNRRGGNLVGVCTCKAVGASSIVQVCGYNLRLRMVSHAYRRSSSVWSPQAGGGWSARVARELRYRGRRRLVVSSSPMHCGAHWRIQRLHPSRCRDRAEACRGLASS